MKYFSLAIALAAAAITIPALGADVGVSVSIGEPGFYGQLDLGNVARPSVQYSRPVIIRRVRGRRARADLPARASRPCE